MTDNWQPQAPASRMNGPDGIQGFENDSHGGARKKVVVVGLGMVGISFM
jgi:nitrite reductase (NAD(P)H)